MSNILFSNSYNNFSYWFSQTAIDNNGEVVSDINAGITKLIPELREQLDDTNNEHIRFIIPDCQISLPDIAASRFYGNENMWWFVCLENQITNPFNEYNNQYMYYAFSKSLLSDHSLSAQSKTGDKESKIGTIIELN